MTVVPSGGMTVNARQKEMYWNYRREGWSIVRSANQAGFSESTGLKIEKQKPENGTAYLTLAAEAKLPSPILSMDLRPEARTALEDFGYWRARYLDRRSTPWQEEAAHAVLGWLASPDTEFIVENCPPGSGKTTLWSDIIGWLICRDRAIRVIWMSHTLRLAAQPVNRVRRLLERPRPVVGALGCVAQDYGRFKPEAQDIWRREEFTVTAMDEQPLEDKEPTVAAYGMDSEFLGHRGNLVVGDDLVTGAILRTLERVEAQQKWWEEEGQTRVEPGGACVLNGQRMGARDLYRFALNQTLEDTALPRYQHIIYPAHFEDRCQGTHRDNPDHAKDAQAWPQGCLLDPIRLPWSGAGGLLTIQSNRSEKYRVQYQQEDVDPAGVLVPMLWIEGGRDSDGTEYPGCWDKFRGLCEIPKGLAPPVYSIASADPSPTKFWAIGWWLYHPASEQRFLLDLVRQTMDAPDFLDWNENSKQFFGVMQDWQVRSRQLGYPISHWIVENNAAQRFLLQHDFMKRWQRLHGVQVIGHSTTARNKLDPEYGVQMLANRYRFGNVRLPGKNVRDASGLKDPGRMAAMKLVDEVTHYDGSGGGTDDCIMQQWFFEYAIPSIAKTRRDKQPKLWRPNFLQREAENVAS